MVHRPSRHGGLSPLLWLFMGALALGSARAHAQAPELLQYEPPSVDYVYPEAGSSERSPTESKPPPPSEPAAEPVAPPPARAAPKAPAATAPAQAPSAPSAEPPPETAEESGYGATARVKTPAPPGAYKIPQQAARDLPGAFGDPLRVLEALPGVVPLTSGLPYAYVRGAPPAAMGYYYDGIPLPQIYHAAFGPAVLHPRAIGAVRLDAGIPEARYGRRLGGALVAEGSPYGRDFAAEVELRLIDLGAFVQTPLKKGSLMVSGRLGYPKLALLIPQAMGIVDKDTSINYGDSQVRFEYPLNRRDRFELVWLSSFDKVNLPGLSNDPRAGASKMQFQRIETRFRRELPRGEVGAALRFGYDNSELGTALTVKAFQFGPRLWSKLVFGRHTLRFGGDLFGSKGSAVNGPGSIASPDGDLSVQVPPIAQASARNQGGVYAQAGLQLGERTQLLLGLRADYWSVQSKIQIGVDPRIRAIYRITDDLNVHAAFGMTHQPAVFLLPTPGLTEVALDRGLMRSFQSELGAEYKLARSTTLKAQGFYHHYDNLLLPELIRDGAIPENPPLVTSDVYGVETFVMRDMGERVSGWISYTLSFANADSGPEVVGKFKPDYDVRHVLNTVLSWRIWRGLTLGGRFQARSGRVVEQPNPRYTQRLPWFTRVDARIGYAWQGRYGAMTAYLEWLNVFVQREYTDADCLLGRCRAKAAPVIAIPNLGVRAEF